GMSHLLDGRFRTLNIGVTYGATQDDSGVWWLATPKGVLRVPDTELMASLGDRAHSMEYRLYDHRDGLPGPVSLPGSGAVITKSADGRIWVATDNGVASIDPRAVEPPPAPEVLIASARVDGVAISPATTTRIPAGRRDLEIDFTATSL